MCGYKKYKELMDPLVSYSCDKIKDMDLPKLGSIRLIYEIIREAIADLHQNRSKKNQKDAEEYFNSEVFEHHCKCILISKQLMLRIALNPNQYLNTMNYNKPDIENESTCEFSDLP